MRAISQERSAPATTPSGAGRAVLVADDDAAVRGFTATILRAHGYRVLEAQTGDEALRFVDEEPSLVIADLVMPPQGGLELVDELRRHVPGLKVLFISGYGVLSGSSNTLDPLLSKPFTPADLLARVAELVGPAAATTPET